MSDVEVVKSTGSKIRKFLYELAEGTLDYRSLHNLTEQVEHQYHGRFIVELIQNAHDALSEAGMANPGRIEVAIHEEGGHGALYVANDGSPFTASNFSSLSQLGNSDKDPQKSIGNKGIGFRSVLEVTREPVVYSRAKMDSSAFDGFSFAFSPSTIEKLFLPVLQLMNGDDRPPAPGSDEPLVDWDPTLIAKFRERVRRSAESLGQSPEEWIKRELSFLSPYLLPQVADPADAPVFVHDFERRGFATLIRLPFKSNAAREVAANQLRTWHPNGLLFLESLTSLTLDDGDGWKRSFSRTQSARKGSKDNGQEVLIDIEGSPDTRGYWLWKRRSPTADAPPEVRNAIAQLPGKWPQLESVEISVGVQIGAVPDHARLSVFLPTLLESGCGAHINAPFFSDMSRTLIDFDDRNESGSLGAAAYNKFLLGEAARLTVSVISDELSCGAANEAGAIVDLLSPVGSDESSKQRWQNAIGSAASEQKIEIAKAPWILSERGWNALNETSLVPVLEAATVLTRSCLRKHAKFVAVHPSLDSRNERYRQLSKQHHYEPMPPPEQMASTIEAVAKAFIQQADPNWNDFWNDVESLLPHHGGALAGKNVLLGADGLLHAANKNCAVFFVPRQGLSEDEEVENESDVREIPPALQPFVAFLSDRIQIYEDRGGRPQETQTRKFLIASKLVSKFRREDIFNEVLVPRTPTLPVPIDGELSALCRDILGWGLRLLTLLTERGKGDRLFRLLRRLPAPCIDGWYPLEETSFGPGWTGTLGELTAKYLSRAPSKLCKEAFKRLLLSPNDDVWGKSPPQIELLRSAGVVDGLRLRSVSPEEWSSFANQVDDDVDMPASSPAGSWTGADWTKYRGAVRSLATPKFRSGTYKVQKLFLLPGLESYSDFDDEIRIAFMDAILASLPHWEPGWHQVPLSRVSGNPDTIGLPSPLAWSLGTLSWLWDKEVSSWFGIRERWYISAQMSAGRRHHFSYLRPLPINITLLLDRNAQLASGLQILGLPRFDLEKDTEDARLLKDLADAIRLGEVSNRDAFLGHVRAAWRTFSPGVNAGKFPAHVLVDIGAAGLAAIQPSPTNPIYLPDSDDFLDLLLQFNLPIVAIDTQDAKRLASAFDRAFPGSIVRTSNLDAIPIIDGVRLDGQAGERLSDHSQLGWLPTVLLAIAAFQGPSAKGTETKSMRSQMQTLRTARIATAAKLAISLTQDDQPLGTREISALWSEKYLTLWVHDLSDASLARASGAFSALLSRGDLEVPIKLALKEMTADPQPDDILRGLAELRIQPAQYSEARALWVGDVRLLIDRLIPLLIRLEVNADVTSLIELTTEEAVTEFLVDLRHPGIHADAVLSLAREASDPFEFGWRAYSIFDNDERLQLAGWNKALSYYGQPLLRNNEASEEFRAHLLAAGATLRRMILTVLHPSPGSPGLRALSSELQSLTVPEEFADAFWEVGFRDAMMVIASWFQERGVGEPELSSLRCSESAEKLAANLAALGIPPSGDPLEVGQENRLRLDAALGRLQDIALAWAISVSVPELTPWIEASSKWATELAATFEADAYGRRWAQTEAWAITKSLKGSDVDAAFWTEVRASSDADDLIGRLGLTTELVENARSKVGAIQDEQRRRQRVVQVCGSPFDSAEDNLDKLWAHICQASPLPAFRGNGLDLKSFTDIARMPIGRQRKDQAPHGRSQAPPKRASRMLENLVGLAGEIHAYRHLSAKYGGLVSPTSWVSSNSYRAGLNQEIDTNDGAGCDFIITLGDRTYSIEVKSTDGDSESFSMGSSEIRLARELGRQKNRRRKHMFLVLRVNHVLSADPDFQILPNPYDPKYQHLFAIEEADARLRYRSNK